MPTLWRPSRGRTHKELAAQVQLARREGIREGALEAAKSFAEEFGQMGTLEKAGALGVSVNGTGSVAPAFGGVGGKSPSGMGLGNNNLGNTAIQQSLLSRVTQNLSTKFDTSSEEIEAAMAEGGLTWGPPFPPGRPLDPFQGYRQPMRTYNYSVGENTQVTPRWNRISFPTIKAIYDAYDVAQICVRHLINDIRSLEYDWVPAKGVKVDVENDIQIAEAFFETPDGRQPFNTWLAEWLQDILRYDAGTLYQRTNRGGDIIALEVIDGTTVIPLIDYFGRTPLDTSDTEGDMGGSPITPAYVQIIEGLVWDWLTADDVIYMPWNPLPESQYGQAPIEAVMLSANTDIRFQWHFLQYFTEGTMPAGFMEAPPDLSDPTQLTDWENNWNAVMLGDQAKLRQVRWVPSGAKFTPTGAGADKFDSDFPLYLMRRTCAAFGVTPADLGFTEDVNRATGDTQIDVQFRVGTRPLLNHVEGLINLFLHKKLNLRCSIQFDDGQEIEDRVATAQAHQIYVGIGIESVDEVRTDLGLPIDKNNPVPRFINNPRQGPQPLAQIIASSGQVDPETYAPEQSAIDAERAKQAQADQVAAQGQTLGVAAQAQTLDQSAENHAIHTQQATQPQAPAGPGNTPPGAASEGSPTSQLQSDAKSAASAVAPPAPAIKLPTGPKPSEAALAAATPDAVTKENWREVLAAVDRLEKEASTPTGGVLAATGVQGVDLGGDDDDEDDEEFTAKKQAEMALALRRWRKNTISRMKNGRRPKRFVDSALPPDVTDGLMKELDAAESLGDVVQVFKAADEAVGKWLEMM